MSASQALSFDNPVFAAYAIAASLLVLKTVGMAWATVWQMTIHKAGYRAPEDAERSLINPDPRPGQVGPHDRVDRFRRIHQNDLENVPMFLAAGLLFVVTGPPLLLAQGLFYGYVATRALHFWAYATARSHDIRATFWSLGVLMVMGMALRVLWVGAAGGS